MTRLAELVTVNPPGRRAGPYSFIGIADIDAELGIANPRTEGRASFDFRSARAGDVLFAQSSPAMESGKAAIVPTLETAEALVSGDLVVLRPVSGVDPRLIWAFLRQRQVRSALEKALVGGSGRRRLRTETLGQLEIPVPSERSWGTRVQILEHLERARRLRRDFGERVRTLSAAAASSVASGPLRVPLGSLEPDIRPGTPETVAGIGTIQSLRAANLVDGRIDRSDPRFLPANLESPPDLLRPGDLIVVGTADRIGGCAVYEDEGEGPPTSYAASLLRIRAETLDVDFLWAWLQSAEAKEALARISLPSPGPPRLTRETLASLPIPRVDAQAQAWAGKVARLARRLSRAGRAQATLLERAVQAHLAGTFGTFSVDPAIDNAKPPEAEAEILLPHVFEFASERQRRLWQRVSELGGGFGLNDLTRSEADYAWIQHCLSIFEQLGLVVRDSTEQSYCWRQPDLELEVLG